MPFIVSMFTGTKNKNELHCIITRSGIYIAICITSLPCQNFIITSGQNKKPGSTPDWHQFYPKIKVSPI
jgi:hypothetical protein